MEAKEYIDKLEKLSICIFQIYNLELGYDEEMRMAKKALNAFKEEQLETFPYDSIADYFSEKVMRYTGQMQDYTIDRLLLKINAGFAVFHLSEFKDDIENPIWDRVCDRVQFLFVAFSEILRAAGRTDKIEQVPNVSYRKTMQEELGIVGKQDENEIPIELDNEEFREILNRAIDKKYIKKESNGYKWQRTKVLCSYFSQQVSLALELSNKRIGDEGKIGISWKPFETLFNTKNLANQKQTWIKENGVDNFSPNGACDIDDIVNP